MKSLPAIKRGDTFGATCTYKENKVPVSVADLSISCQIRDPDTKELVSEMVITKANQEQSVGVFHLSPTNPDTSDWPVKTLIADIEISQGGVIRSTQTFRIPVYEDVTQ